jgi:hypothetical protein
MCCYGRNCDRFGGAGRRVRWDMVRAVCCFKLGKIADRDSCTYGETPYPILFSLVLSVSVSKRAILLVEAAAWSLARLPTMVRIEAEALGVVDIFVTGQTVVDRLPQQGEQAVLGVRPCPGILQAAWGRAGQSEGVIEFPIGQESGATGDGGPVEL